MEMDDGTRAHVEALIERRNKYATQAQGLQARADALYEKLKRLDAEVGLLVPATGNGYDGGRCSCARDTGRRAEQSAGPGTG